MAKQLLGKEVTAALNEKIKANVAELQGKGVNPTLCIIRVGENPSDISYERGATKRCETLGVACEKILLPEDVSQEELLATIDKVNKDDSIHGVLLFRPLPKHLDQAVIENALAPEKDVDCMTDLSMSGVFTGKKIGFPPCTPQACMEILDHYGIDCTGKKAVVIGRSLVVGKPAAMMLVKKNATVTICHTRTVDMPSVAREADIIIVAAFGQRVNVIGDSMSPVLKNGNVVMINHFIYNIKDPSRGDIAAFQKDGDERYFVKRIVGLPGETVQIKEGKLLIDGKPLKAEYVSDIGYAGTASEPVHLGKDEYFLLGDNETASDDSREEKIGNIKKKEIYGEVWFVIKPWSDIGFVSD